MAPITAPRKPTVQQVESSTSAPESPALASKDEARLRSGVRKSISDEDLERFDRRARETIPAPPDPSET